MQRKILVAYATRAGSTAEIADIIAKEMEDEATEVDVLDVGEVVDLEPYWAVVIGAPLYMGKVIHEIPHFVQQHREKLARLPIAAFVVGTSMVNREEKLKEQARAIMAEAILPLKAREIGVFAGAITPTKLSIGQKAVLKLVKAPYGDFRDWDAIRSWADPLPEKLRAYSN